MYFIIYAIIGLVVYFFVSKTIVEFVRKKLKENYIININKKYLVYITRIFFIILPFYLFAVFQFSFVQELNVGDLPRSTMDINVSKDCKLYLWSNYLSNTLKNPKPDMPSLIENGSYHFGHHWLLEINPIKSSPIEVLKHEKCLATILKKMYRYDGKTRYIIYEGEKKRENIVFEIIKYKK